MTYQIITGREARAIGGLDTTILSVPPQMFITINGESVLNVRALAAFLRPLSEKLASDIGEELHHAEYVLTRDPAVVESRGSMHDCDECHAAVRRALRFLIDHPDTDLLVGTLWWAMPDPDQNVWDYLDGVPE